MASPSIEDQLRYQIEYYFSPQNLATDVYLMKQMDSNRYVPLSIISQFPKVKSISNDINVVIAAISTSKTIELNATKDGLRAKNPRNILLIRNLPQNLTIEQIKSLFSPNTDLHSKITHIKIDGTHGYSVTFPDDDICQQANTFIQTQTYESTPIQSIIKQPAPIFLSSPNQYNRHQPLFYPSQHQHNNNMQNNNPNYNQNRTHRQQPHHQSTSQHHQNSHHQQRQPRQHNQQSNQQSSNQQPSQRHQQPITTTQPEVVIVEPRVGYQGPFIRYDRQEVAKIIENLSKTTLTPPKSFFNDKGEAICPVINKTQRTTTTLLHPIPVMFPASPSPEMAMKQPEVLPPFLQLGQPPTTNYNNNNNNTSHSTSTNHHKPSQLPSLPPKGGISLTSSVDLPPLTSSTLFKALNLQSSAISKEESNTTTTTPATTTAAPVITTATPTTTTTATPTTTATTTTTTKGNNNQHPKKMNPSSATFVPRSTTSATKDTTTTNTNTQRTNNRNNNRDNVTKDSKPRSNGPKEVKSNNNNGKNVRVDEKKRAALDSSAFPSSFGMPTSSKTTSTTKPSNGLNFAATVAKEADPSDVEQQKQQLAAKKKALEVAAKAKLLEKQGDKAANPEQVDGDNKDDEKKPTKGKKQKKEKVVVPEGEEGDKAAGTDGDNKVKKTKPTKANKPKPDNKAEKPTQQEKPVVVKDEKAHVSNTPAPAGSWAAMLKPTD